MSLMFYVIQKPAFRTFLFFAVFLMLMTLPWWATLIVIFVLNFLLPMYLEALFYGFIFDTLYSQNFSLPYTYLTLATALLIVTIFIKDRIRT